MTGFQNGLATVSSVDKPAHGPVTRHATSKEVVKQMGPTMNHEDPKPTPLKTSALTATRVGILNAFSQFSQLIQASPKPLPTQLEDGTFNQERKWTGLGDDIKNLRYVDVKTLKEIIASKVKREQIQDDKTMIMERTIQLVSNLPSESKLRVELTNTFLAELWYSLEHPPSLYVGPQFQYRTADGSNNNILMPKMGAAGTYYARSVRPTVVAPAALPDPNTIFDAVMKRSEYKKHPNNVSSILWYWASIIIHDLFWTDYRDMNRSKTSSYLDFSPLYGSNQEMQDTIRTFKQGKLKADCFADKRLLGMPPGVGVLLIMFNRFHNFVCDNLMAINEGGRFTPPAEGLDEEKSAAVWKQYDNDLFQTARLVTSGLYINITLLDYVRNIVNLNRVDTTWTLDPRADSGIDAGTKQGAERGTGNVVSAEFNLCYRWHSCISVRDEAWIEEMYRELLGKPAAEVSMQDMIAGFVRFDKMTPEDPIERSFHGLKRGADGRLSDDDLVAIISDSIEDCAGSFGARNVPASMRAVEILGIIQGRRWNVAGLNEFRKHFGLKPHETFEDINSDPGVANSLRRLYDHPDFVELYPGLVAEEHKNPMVPGVGICPTYTISRVVLSDAVCLVRGDRHYTTDYNARNLTNWGYNEVQYDLGTNHGCCFYNLVLRSFPEHFKTNSVYAHYPMVTPSENEKILKNINRAHLFDFSRPGTLGRRVEISSLAGATEVLSRGDKYSAPADQALSVLVAPERPSSHCRQNAPPAPIGGDPGKAAPPTPLPCGQLVATMLVRRSDPSPWPQQVRDFYRVIAEHLLMSESYTLAGRIQVDLVRDVAHAAHVRFASRVFGLPLDNKLVGSSSSGSDKKPAYTEYELYAVLSLIAEYLSGDTDPVKAFPLRQASKAVAAQLATLVESGVKRARSGGGFLSFLTGGEKSQAEMLGGCHAELVKGLAQSGMSNHEIAWTQMIPASAGLVPKQAEMFAQAVDFYLSPPAASLLPTIQKLAAEMPSKVGSAKLLGYAMEGVRLSGTTSLCREAAGIAAITEGDGRSVHVKAEDRVVISLASIARDPSLFPEPEAVNPSRPLSSYALFWGDSHLYTGLEASQEALTELFRAVFRRKNVRRGPGPQGRLKKVPRQDGSVQFLRDDWGALSSFPTTMKITWDEE